MQVKKQVPLTTQLLELTKRTYRGRLHSYLMSKNVPYQVVMDIMSRMTDDDIKEICQFHNIKGEENNGNK